MSEFQIDPEFRDLIPPPDSVSRADLEANIEKNGCLDPLIVWTEQKLLLDGHTREVLCRELGKSYDIKYVSLPDRDAAKLWIIKHAIGRRHLTETQVAILRGRAYNAAKAKQGGDHKSKSASDTLINAAEEVAAEFDVSESTIKRDGQLAEAVDALKPTIPSIEQQVASGEVPRAVAVEAAKAETPAKAIQILQRPAKKPVREWTMEAAVKRTKRLIGDELADCPIESIRDYVAAVMEYLEQCGGN